MFLSHSRQLSYVGQFVTVVAKLDKYNCSLECCYIDDLLPSFFLNRPEKWPYLRSGRSTLPGELGAGATPQVSDLDHSPIAPEMFKSNDHDESIKDHNSIRHSPSH